MTGIMVAASLLALDVDVLVEGIPQGVVDLVKRINEHDFRMKIKVIEADKSWLLPDEENGSSDALRLVDDGTWEYWVEIADDDNPFEDNGDENVYTADDVEGIYSELFD